MFDTLQPSTIRSLRTPSNKLPQLLYRVQTPSSQTSFDKSCNLLAKIHNKTPSTFYELRAALTRHLKWGYSRADSYFISAFDSHSAAVKWAKKVGGGSIYRIRTKYLPRDAVVFNVEGVLERLGIDVGKDVRGEYVVLNMVSARAVGLFEVVGNVNDLEESVETEGKAPEAVSVALNRRNRASLTPWERTLQRQSRALSVRNEHPVVPESGIFNLTEKSIEDLCRNVKRKSTLENVVEFVNGEEGRSGGWVEKAVEPGSEEVAYLFEEHVTGKVDGIIGQKVVEFDATRCGDKADGLVSPLFPTPYELPELLLEDDVASKQKDDEFGILRGTSEEESVVSPLFTSSFELPELSLEDDIISLDGL